MRIFRRLARIQSREPTSKEKEIREKEKEMV